MNTKFEIAKVTIEKLNMLVKSIMKQTGIQDPNKAVRLVNSGEWIVSKRSWHEEDDVIRFLVTFDGTTRKDWVTILEKNFFSLQIPPSRCSICRTSSR